MKLEIACPKCEWEPDGGKYWKCSCGHRWNTFETYGRCPACTKVWRDTQCLVDSCGKWSKHVDWYRNLSDIMRKHIEELMEERVTVEQP